QDDAVRREEVIERRFGDVVGSILPNLLRSLACDQQPLACGKEAVEDLAAAFPHPSLCGCLPLLMLDPGSRHAARECSYGSGYRDDENCAINPINGHRAILSASLSEGDHPARQGRPRYPTRTRSAAALVSVSAVRPRTGAPERDRPGESADCLPQEPIER